MYCKVLGGEDWDVLLNKFVYVLKLTPPIPAVLTLYVYYGEKLSSKVIPVRMKENIL